MACARASRWCAADGNGWLTIAETEAAAADDGPLLAQAWLERATAEGMDARSTERPSPARLALATAALRRTGSRQEQSGIRAAARWKLAWELAVEGNQHGALMELDAATYEAEKAGWTRTAIDEMVGGVMRKLGRRTDAEIALSGALAAPPVRRVWVLCDLARMHLTSGDADTAAETLEEAFLLMRANGIEGRLPRILAVRSLLPPGRAKRALTEVMHGV
jgi:tetratricopeptide (TPR) repeat protein